jgi:hypothetical protein
MKNKKGLDFMIFLPFIITIVFAIFYNYATDKADIGEKENITFEPTVKQLFETENIHYYDVDEHIKNHILPCYRHQSLYYKISNYQNSEDGWAPALIMVLFLAASGAFAFIGGGLEPVWSFIISLIINVAIYFLITLLFVYTPIFNRLKLKNYSDVCNVYESEYHYEYLTDIEESVMFRYFLRKIISGIAAFVFLMNIWSTDIY